MSVTTDDPVEYLMKMVETQGGVACATVKDGHVIVFKRASLRSMLEAVDAVGKDTFMIFVKRPDFNG